MILRRVIEHVKAQNWTAVALDFFIVVIGVFMGIQVSNWNDAREARQREHDILENLVAEFDDIVDGAELAAQRSEEIVSSIDTIIAALQASALEEEDRKAFEYGIEWLDVFSPLTFQSGTLDELVSNGELTLIRDAALRSALIQFLNTTAQGNESFMHIRLAMVEYVPAVHLHAQFGASDDEPATLYSYDFPAMAADPVVLRSAGLIRRLQGWYRFWHRNNLETVTVLRDRINAELDQ